MKIPARGRSRPEGPQLGVIDRVDAIDDAELARLRRRRRPSPGTQVGRSFISYRRPTPDVSTDLRHGSTGLRMNALIWINTLATPRL
jgi:hypothetical protein